MEIFILSILVIVNGFFALSEIALVSSKRSRLEQFKVDRIRGASTALKLLDHSEGFLSAIQVGITLIGIVTGVYGGINIADDVMPFFLKFPSTSLYAHEIALVVTVIIITYVSIVIGELVPKTIALSNPEKIAVKISIPILYFSTIFFPFVKLLSVSTALFNKVLGIKKQTEQLTESELRHMIKTASNEGVIEKEQNIIHEKIFYFADKRAKHIMTHRTDLEWIDIDKPASEIKAILTSIHHSKVLCSKGDLDNFKGFLILKDYYKALISGKDNVNLEELIIEPIVAPESMNAQKILTLMRHRKNHFCCIVNEYGGFEGIITLHDIIENIVGEISDNEDNAEPDVFVREDKSVLVSGDASIDTLIEIIDGFTIDYDKIDYSTVGGFVISNLSHEPHIGDKFEFLNYTIEIVDIDINRVDKVLITKDIDI